MKAELRETWYNMCVWMVGFRRIVGPEKISVTCACSNVARRSFIKEEQKGRVAWAHSSGGHVQMTSVRSGEGG